MKTEDTIPEAMYIMKANAPLNTEMYAYCQSEINAGRVNFLIDEQTAKNKLMSQTQGQKMSPKQRTDYLAPYVKTSGLKEQLCNLVSEVEGINIILKQSSKKIPKDRVSALIYGLYYCKLQEDRSTKRRHRSMKDFMFFN